MYNGVCRIIELFINKPISNTIPDSICNIWIKNGIAMINVIHFPTSCWLYSINVNCGNLRYKNSTQARSPIPAISESKREAPFFAKPINGPGMLMMVAPDKKIKNKDDI
jgi:hypothetical protein